MSATPSSSLVKESTVVDANITIVWNIIAGFRFDWWDLVENVTFEGEGNAASIGSTATFFFKDGLSWIVQIVEFSLIKQYVSFQIISSSSPLPFSSAIHTISTTRVTSDNTCFVEWTTVFSNDATSAVIQDSSFKRLDALANLRTVCSEIGSLSRRVSDVEARSRGGSMVESRSRGGSVVDSSIKSPSRTKGGSRLSSSSS